MALFFSPCLNLFAQESSLEWGSSLVSHIEQATKRIEDKELHSIRVQVVKAITPIAGAGGDTTLYNFGW